MDLLTKNATIFPIFWVYRAGKRVVVGSQSTSPFGSPLPLGTQNKGARTHCTKSSHLIILCALSSLSLPVHACAPARIQISFIFWKGNPSYAVAPATGMVHFFANERFKVECAHVEISAHVVIIPALSPACFWCCPCMPVPAKGATTVVAPFFLPCNFEYVPASLSFALG